jgi:enoyl-CoA hydratase/carnithine racemase
MAFEFLLLEKSNGVAMLTLNRPPANSLSVALLKEIGAAFDEMEKDENVRAVVITGAGEKFFCGGAEIKEFNVVDPDEQMKLGQGLFRRIEMLGKPVIAAINGYALGGGCELAMACHIRYAADTAKLGQPEINLGILPGWGGTQRLPRLVGRGRAIELMLTGDMISATEAERIGLVNRVVPAAELKDTTLKLAQRLANNAPLAIRAILSAVDEGLESGLVKGIEIERAKFTGVVGSEDAKAGIQAFLTKQKPVFKGK